MKRLLALILAISTLFLCSCGRQLQSGSTTDTTESTQPSTEETSASVDDTVITQKPMYAISLPPVEEVEKADDGTSIFSCAYQNISLILPEPEVADKIIVDFLNRTDRLIQHAESALTAAKQAYSLNKEWTPHLLQLRYSPQRLDTGILSLRGEKISYTGGAHAGTSGESVTYDLLTGNLLRLTDIMLETVTGDTLCKLVTDALAARAAEESLELFTTYDQTLKQLFRANLSNYEDWYFTTQGLSFYFDPYEIAPFSAGIVSVVIPYSQLTGILKDAYFPAEEDLTSGTVSAALFEDAQISDYTQISEIILEEGTTKLLLYADGSVSDIRINTGHDEEHFVSTARWDSAVFAAHTLTPGDAIMVEADLTSTTLLLSYRTDNEYLTQTIVLDGGIIRIE